MSYTPPPASQSDAPNPFGSPNAPYVPPPPPPARKSPWLFVGLGCGLLILLSFGGCILLGKSVVDSAISAQKQPLDEKAVMASIEGIPLYPKAPLSKEMTKVQRGVIGNPLMKAAMRGNTMEVAAFETKDDSDKVSAWYDKAMDKAGYEPSNSTKMPNFGRGSSEQKQFRKGTDAVIIQTQHNTKNSDYPTIIMVMRIPNYKE